MTLPATPPATAPRGTFSADSNAAVAVAGTVSVIRLLSCRTVAVIYGAIFPAVIFIAAVAYLCGGFMNSSYWGDFFGSYGKLWRGLVQSASDGEVTVKKDETKDDAGEEESAAGETSTMADAPATESSAGSAPQFQSDESQSDLSEGGTPMGAGGSQGSDSAIGAAPQQLHQTLPSPPQSMTSPPQQQPQRAPAPAASQPAASPQSVQITAGAAANPSAAPGLPNPDSGQQKLEPEPESSAAEDLPAPVENPREPDPPAAAPIAESFVAPFQRAFSEAGIRSSCKQWLVDASARFLEHSDGAAFDGLVDALIQNGGDASKAIAEGESANTIKELNGLLGLSGGSALTLAAGLDSETVAARTATFLVAVRNCAKVLGAWILSEKKAQLELDKCSKTHEDLTGKLDHIAEDQKGDWIVGFFGDGQSTIGRRHNVDTFVQSPFATKIANLNDEVFSSHGEESEVISAIKFFNGQSAWQTFDLLTQADPEGRASANEITSSGIYPILFLFGRKVCIDFLEHLRSESEGPYVPKKMPNPETCSVETFMSALYHKRELDGHLGALQGIKNYDGLKGWLEGAEGRNFFTEFCKATFTLGAFVEEKFAEKLNGNRDAIRKKLNGRCAELRQAQNEALTACRKEIATLDGEIGLLLGAGKQPADKSQVDE
ncbi:MAG: hypothetical protein LBI39_03445 [Puniceicoccales bacterium]|nr:hypothetical protein [Puniceicoccales bacterium]